MLEPLSRGFSTPVVTIYPVLLHRHSCITSVKKTNLQDWPSVTNGSLPDVQPPRSTDSRPPVILVWFFALKIIISLLLLCNTSLNFVLYLSWARAFKRFKTRWFSFAFPPVLFSRRSINHSANFAIYSFLQPLVPDVIFSAPPPPSAVAVTS